MDLSPTYVNPPLLPFAKVAIDVHITGLPLPPSHGDSPHMVSVTHLHQQSAEREKFRGLDVNTAHTFVNAW